MGYPPPPGGWGPPPGAGGPPPGGYPPAPGGYPPPPRAGAYALGPPLPSPVVWACPFCRYAGPPTQIEKVSQTGIVVMIALIFLCLPLFWIGLLMKERHRLCPSCGTSCGMA